MRHRQAKAAGAVNGVVRTGRLSATLVGPEWVLALACAAAAPAFAQPPTHGMHPLMTDQRMYVRCRMLNATPPSTVETMLAIDSPSAEATPNQMLHLPAPAPPIRFVQYLPHAVLEQNVAASADDGSPSAAEIVIEGPTQSFRRWLVAGDQERNRLTSYIGTWRYMTVADKAERDELFRQFETEFTRDPKLVVSRPDGEGARELQLAVDRTQTVDELKCRIRVRQFMPDYAMDRSTKSPVNKSDRRGNPAALVDIELDGKTESRWIFAKFPEFSQQHGDAPPIRVVLDCPVQGEGDTPDFALVTIARKTHEIWARAGGSTSARTLEMTDETNVPGSQYRFRIANYVPKGTMIETYRRDDQGKASPALQVEYANEKNSPTRLWLAMGHYRKIMTPVGAMVVSLEVQGESQQTGHP
ncbi:MAG: hypothetical protein AAB341_05505 [Planctomycetota bacterium]